jgi:hypothetical protein
MGATTSSKTFVKRGGTGIPEEKKRQDCKVA